MVFLDGATEILPGKFANTYKNFTYNEWFFQFTLKTSQMFQASFNLNV